MNAPPPYAMLGNQGSQNIRPPPYRSNVSRYHSDYYYNKRSRGGGWCLRCICCCYCCLFLQIFVLAGCAVYFYAVYRPQLPTYKVEGLNLKSFDIQTDFSLNTGLEVTVKAENPNSNIGFIYGRDSSVVVTYIDSILCSGKLPNFEQGYKNTTLMKIDLKGRSEFGSGLQQALQENKHNGRIPLLIKVKAPVNIVVWKLPMRQFMVNINCSLIVDNLAPNKKIGIVSSNYNFAFSL